MDRCKFGFVSRSRSADNLNLVMLNSVKTGEGQQMALVLKRSCHGVRLCYCLPKELNAVGRHIHVHVQWSIKSW